MLNHSIIHGGSHFWPEPWHFPRLVWVISLSAHISNGGCVSKIIVKRILPSCRGYFVFGLKAVEISLRYCIKYFSSRTELKVSDTWKFNVEQQMMGVLKSR